MLDLLDYRRQVAGFYAAVRAADDPAVAWVHWREQRDLLFRSHPQSALDADQKAVFGGLRYYDYDPAYRVLAEVEPVLQPHILDIELGDDGHFRCQCFGQVYFSLPTGDGVLSLFWIVGYGGGLFLPFGDATNKHATYGAGRYLYDSIKGADLGTVGDQLVLDFNYAYNPSCVYNPRWVCPLAPPENRLEFPVPVGEQVFQPGK